MRVFALYAGTVLIWGSTWLAIKYQLGTVAPEWSIAYRFAIATTILFAYCLLTAKRMRYGARDHLGMAAQGLMLFSANYFVFYLATYHLTTGLIAVVFSAIVIANIGFGAILFRAKVRPRVLLGAAFGIAGLGVVFAPEIEALHFADSAALGLGLSLLATVIASLGNMAAVSNQRRGLPVLQANAFGMAYGTAFMTAFALAGGAPPAFDPSPLYVASLLYLAVFGSVLAFGFYLTLLGLIGADRAAYATVLFPVVALALSAAFEGYLPGPAAWAGFGLVLIGNGLALSRRRGSEKARAVAPGIPR